MFRRSCVIYFHEVKDATWFEKLILHLNKLYDIIPISEIDSYYYNRKKIKNSLHITFDDGHLSFYEIVYPIIQKYNIPVSLYVSPYIAKTGNNFWFQELAEFDNSALKSVIEENFSFPSVLFNNYSMKEVLKYLNLHEINKIMSEYKRISDTPKMESQNMNINQIVEVSSSGLVSVGAHTMSHPILKSESAENSKQEIVNSISELSKMLKQDINYFVYPNGFPGIDFGEREIDILREMNIRLAFSTKPDYLSKKYDPLSIPRFGISFGSNRYISYKLIYGKIWEILKSFKGKSKIKNRRKIEKLLKQNAFTRL